MIELDFDTAEISRQLDRIKDFPNEVQMALYPAMSDTMDYLKGELAERLMADVPLPRRFIKRAIKVIGMRVSRAECSAILHVASRAVPLIEYDAQPLEITARRGMRSRDWPDFTYALRDGQRRLGAERAAYSLPFIANMHNRGKSGHMGVYGGTAPSPGKPAGQIKELYGPRVQYHAANPDVASELFMKTENFLTNRLTQIVNRILD